MSRLMVHKELVATECRASVDYGNLAGFSVGGLSFGTNAWDRACPNTGYGIRHVV